MVCKRCGCELSESDRFCRSCGKRLRRSASIADSALPEIADLSPSDPSAPGSIVPSGQRKKWILFISLAAVLLLASLLIVLLPQLKQAFMSPASYYLESEANAFYKFSNSLQSLVSPLYEKSQKSVSGLWKVDMEGEEYESVEPYLENLLLQTEYQTNAKGRSALDLNALYEYETVGSLLATVADGELSLTFPEMTEKQVICEISDLFLKLTETNDETLRALTGYSRKELSAWITSYLEPILLEVLEESEQTLGFDQIGGTEVSTVTFSLEEPLIRDALDAFAVQVKRDDTLVSILKNLSAFINTYNDAKSNLEKEFNLNEEDLGLIPILEEISLESPTLKEGSLRELIRENPSETDIREYLKRLSEKIEILSEELSPDTSLSLTAFYQGTDLIGRSLRQGDDLLFESFRYRREGVTILDVGIKRDSAFYHFNYKDSSDSNEGIHEISLTKAPADPSTGQEIEPIFTLAANYEKNATVGGVPAFLGEIRLTHNDVKYTITNELIFDDQTRFSYDCRTTDQSDESTSFLRLRAQLTYSNRIDAQTIRIAGNSNFDSEAFSEVIHAMKENLKQSELFDVLFGAGSREAFLAEEELSADSVESGAENDSVQTTPEENSSL